MIVVSAPFFIMSTNAYVTYSDNLDSEFIYLHLLKSTGMLFHNSPDAIVPNIMNGLPRVYFHSEFSFIRVLFFIFPSFWAYVINLMIIRLIGFAGMFLLMKDYFTGGDKRSATFVAALFAMVPLYVMYGLSVAGVPLILWAFLNILRSKYRWYHILIISVFPFYSHFAMIGPFLIFLLLAIAGYFILVLREKVNIAYYFSLVLMFVSFLIANYNIILSYIFPSDILSHRSEWSVPPYSVFTAFKQTVKVILSGHYHSTTFLAVPIYLMGLITLWKIRHDKIKILNLSIPFVIIFFISVFMAAYPFIRYALKDVLHIITTFQLTRFSFLIPVMWFIIIGLSFKYRIGSVKYLYLLLAIQLLIICVSNKEIKKNYMHIVTKGSSTFNYDGFNAVFSQNLYQEIMDHIGTDPSTYRVVSIGIEPAVAIYNGFYTLDSYQNYYPLKYKHEFRKIISKELDKNEFNKEKFDKWGNKCYMYVAELQDCCYFDCHKNQDCEINNLEINVVALRELGGSYIFSGVPVNNYSELGINFVKKFTSPTSRFNVYLYKL